MTDIIKIERKICVESKFLTKDLKKYIFTKIKENAINECSKEYGYFLNIIKLIEIKDNYISSNCENIFIVVFEAETLKPEVGKIFEGIVCMIFSGGIFINIQNKIKVLIPLSSLKDYEYNNTKKCFENKSRMIKENDTLSVVISGTKYSKQSYSCFGNVVEN